MFSTERVDSEEEYVTGLTIRRDEATEGQYEVNKEKYC